MKIVNQTFWNTRQLKSIVLQLLKKKLPQSRLRLQTIVCAHPYQKWARPGKCPHVNFIRVPTQMTANERIDFCWSAMYTMGLSANVSSNDLIRQAQLIERYGWVLDMPLEKKPPRKPPAPAEVIAKRIADAKAKQAKWKTRAKRAATAIKKYERVIKRLEKRRAT